MREILFRGKRIDNGEWVYGYYAELPNKIGSDEPISSYILFTRQGAEFDSESYCAEVIPSTIGQYTGLTDKNGTKIFEGDIVQTKYATGEVKHGFFSHSKCDEYECRHHGWYIACEWENCETNTGFNLGYKTDFYPCEVIGNIHENTEEERIVFGVKL